jgi:uncharacterized protein YbcI
MDEVAERQVSLTARISNALVALHKEQFGRGPTKARAEFAGADILVCVMSEPMLPAEKKMVEMGGHEKVRDARNAYQAATKADFIAAVEKIVQRKVVAFASAIDPESDMLFETFYFGPRETGPDARS